MFSRASLGLSLGPLLASLVLPWASLGFCRANWCLSLALLGPSWLPPGSLLASPGQVLGGSRPPLGSSWASLGLSWASLFEVPFSGPIFGPLFVQFWLQFWGSFSVLVRTFFGVHFWNHVLRFFDQFWGSFSVLFRLFFALGRHLVEAAFLKDLPCEMLVFRGRGVHETLRKAVPKEVQKRPPKKTRKSTENDPRN